MYHFVDAIQDTKGNALVGYFVALTSTVDSSDTTIYADKSQTPIISVSGIANKALVDANGDVSLYVVPGNYNVDVYAPDAVTKLHTTSDVPMISGATTGTALDYGAIADDNGTIGTDNYTALQAAIDALTTASPDTDGYVKGAGKLILPKGKYYCSQALVIKAGIIIEGEGTPGHAPASQIRFADGVSGFIAEYYITSGEPTAIVAAHSYGQCVTFRNFGIIGPLRNTESGITGGEAEHHGIVARTTVVVEDMYINGFRGDGLHAETTSGGGAGLEGNSNVSYVSRLRVTNVRNGVFIDGADSNAWTLTAVNGTYCRQHTVWDSSFLGCTHIGHHSSAAGMIPGVPPSIVTIGGNRYNVVQGQAAGASTNAPPSATVTMTIASPGVVTWTAHGLGTGTAVCFSTTGALPTGLVAGTTYYVLTTTANTFTLAATVGGAAINTSGSQSGVHTASAAIDNTWWLFLNSGGVDTTANIPTWVSGTTYREGGCYRTDGAGAANQLIGLYAESGQGPLQAITPTNIVGGLWGGRLPVTTGNYIAGDRIVAPSPTAGNTFGQTRVSYSSSTRQLGVHNSGAMSAGGQISVNFENGLEADGVTPAAIARMYAYGSTTSPATTEGTIVFQTRTFGGTGAYTDRFVVDGVNLAVKPAVDNLYELGYGGTIWKVVRGYSFVASTSVTLGGGTALTKAVVYTPTITPASVAAATVAEQTFTVTGLTTADKVIVNPPAIANATGIAGARVSAADTLAIRFTNPTAGALTPTSGVYTTIAIRS